VTKPVGIVELRSRVRAALRRLRRAEDDGAGERDAEGALRHATLSMRPAARLVRIDERSVDLTRSEFAVLEALLRAGGAVRSRAQLLQAIYGDDAYRDPRGVDVHVHHLREKLQDRLGHAEFSFGGLIGISGGTYCNRLPGGETPQFRPERRDVEMFDEDFVLECLRLVQFHEFVRVARITVFATELAPSVGVDHPAEGHARTVAARNIFPRGKFEVFGLALGFKRGAFRR